MEGYTQAIEQECARLREELKRTQNELALANAKLMVSEAHVRRLQQSTAAPLAKAA